MDTLYRYKFSNVLTYPPCISAIWVGVFIMFGYFIIKFFCPTEYYNWWIMSCSFCAIVYMCIYLLHKICNKTVLVGYTKEYVVFQIGKKEKRYRKTDLLGFYSLDYINTSQYKIAIQFVFKDGCKLSLFEDSPFEKSEEVRLQKNESLKEFLLTSTHYFGFKLHKRVKWRSRLSSLNYADTWYTKL